MATFIRLVSMTEQGVKNILKFSEQVAEAKKILEANNARFIEVYATLGRYDFVAIIDAPDEKAIAKVSALIASQGNFRAETLPAVPLEEFTKAIETKA